MGKLLIAKCQELGCTPRPGTCSSPHLPGQTVQAGSSIPPTSLPATPQEMLPALTLKVQLSCRKEATGRPQFLIFFCISEREVKLLEKSNGQSPQQVSYFLFLLLPWENNLFSPLSIKFSITQSFSIVFIT